MRTVAGMTLQHIQFAGAEVRVSPSGSACQQSAELVILFIRHRAQRPVTGRGFTCLGSHQTALRIARTRSMSHSESGRRRKYRCVQVAEPSFSSTVRAGAVCG